MTKFCARCKKEIKHPKNNKQKYCKDCAYIVDLERSKLAAKKKRQITTGTLGPNPIKNKNGSINIKAEHHAILKEMKKLGLRKDYD